jgi:hypothetical protein
MIRITIALLIIVSAGCRRVPGNDCLRFDLHQEWISQTGSTRNTIIVKEEQIGGNQDLMGNGALCLAKGGGDFHASSTFKESGEWTSRWVQPGKGVSLNNLTVSMLSYGKEQDMRSGWTKFEGNPLVCQAGWHHATGQTLTLPDSLPGQPADQALFRGTGKWEGKWLLFFNIGGWAVNGWGMAVADSLAPLKRGINPFSLAEPYPLAIGKYSDTIHAPNDFYYQDGTWYAPCETGKVRDTIQEGISVGLETMQIRYRVIAPHLWTSRDLVHWTNDGMLNEVTGHDPGITFDGHVYYLICEDGESLVGFSSEDPTGSWHALGTLLNVGDHTGDPDLIFMNNRWHMFFDDAPHFHYQIGYASAKPGDFPAGWIMNNKIFGPHNPEQGQTWDDDGLDGNNFGTGDPDVALEGNTLYMTYEWPVGIAWKELDIFSSEGIEVTAVLEADADGDDQPDGIIQRIMVEPGLHMKYPLDEPMNGKFRIRIEMGSNDSLVSPMVTSLVVGQE